MMYVRYTNAPHWAADWRVCGRRSWSTRRKAPSGPSQPTSSTLSGPSPHLYPRFKGGVQVNFTPSALYPIPPSHELIRPIGRVSVVCSGPASILEVSHRGWWTARKGGTACMGYSPLSDTRWLLL